MYRLITISLFITVLAYCTAAGQERTDFRYWDSLTYSQYNNELWKELSGSARKAVSLSHDYYYMRMRLGISLYERGNYLSAISHFRHALEFNNNDPVALEYIYYCYLLSGKTFTANAIASDFSPALRSRTAVDEISKHTISIDYLYKNALSEMLIAEYSDVEGYGNTGNLIIPSNYSNAAMTISQKTGDKTSLTYGITYLRQHNILFYNDGSYMYNNYTQIVNQFQFYLSFTYSDKMGLTITPAVHYLNTGYPLLGINSAGMNPYAYTYKVTEHNVVTSLTLGKSAGLFDIVCEGVWSHLNYSNHLQAEGAVYLRPTGNNNFYFGGGAALKSDENEGSWSYGLVSSGLLGFGIANRLWIDFTALWGDIKNYSDRSGYLVYNGVNEIDYIIKTDLSVRAGNKGTWIYAGARYGSEQTAFIPAGETVASGYNENYKTVSIIGGISWTF